MLKDVEVLILRGVVGGLMAGHGAQKLFGAFEGPGLRGTAGMMGALGLQPAEHWAKAAALGEFGGGALTALGLANPLGEIGIVSSMAMATGTAHWGKPVWVTQGGAELPIINSAAALALAIAGPGQLSLDNALGIKVPAVLTALTALVAAGLVGYGLNARAMRQAAPGQADGASEQPEDEQQQSASA
jgi:putative oxidoreductase